MSNDDRSCRLPKIAASLDEFLEIAYLALTEHRTDCFEQSRNIPKSLILLVPVEGIEPSTY